MGWRWRLLLRLVSRERAWSIMRHFLNRDEQRELLEHRAGQIIEHCENTGLELMIEPLIAVSDRLPLNEEGSAMIARLIETAYTSAWQHADAGQAEPEPQVELDPETNGHQLH